MVLQPRWFTLYYANHSIPSLNAEHHLKFVFRWLFLTWWRNNWNARRRRLAYHSARKMEESHYCVATTDPKIILLKSSLKIENNLSNLTPRISFYLVPIERPSVDDGDNDDCHRSSQVRASSSLAAHTAAAKRRVYGHRTSRRKTMIDNYVKRWTTLAMAQMSLFKSQQTQMFSTKVISAGHVFKSTQSMLYLDKWLAVNHYLIYFHLVLDVRTTTTTRIKLEEEYYRLLKSVTMSHFIGIRFGVMHLLLPLPACPPLLIHWRQKTTEALAARVSQAMYCEF